jgi:hypothetical protein
MKRTSRKNFKSAAGDDGYSEAAAVVDDFIPEKTERKLGLAMFSGLFLGLIAAFLVFLYSPALRDLAYRLVPK